MDATALAKLHEDYRRAIEQARDEALPIETRNASNIAASDMRFKIDEALINDKQEREDTIRATQVEEAKARAAKLVAGIVEPMANPFPLEAVKAYGASKTKGDKLSFEIPLYGRTVDPRIAAQFAKPQGADWTTTDTTTYSSYAVPQTWETTVRTFQVAMSGVLRAGPTILNTANGNQINYPKLTTDMTSLAGTEGSAATETNPVFGTAPLNSYRIDGWTPIADELFRDSGVDVEGLLRTLAARSLAIKAAGYYGDIDVGTGTSLPAAITVGITNGKTAASQTVVTLDEAIELQESVLPQYAAMGSWIGNAAVTLAFRLAKNGDGNYTWQPSSQLGQPDMFMGNPWFKDVYFDASAAGNIPLIFGDVAQAYIVRRIGGIQVDLSRDFAFTSFETTARWAMYHDAALIDTIACKALTLAP